MRTESLTDPLSAAQQIRAACLHEASRALLGGDPLIGDLLRAAEYIETGHWTHDEPVRHQGPASGDEAIWSAKEVSR
jgi:hypothetical protein